VGEEKFADVALTWTPVQRAQFLTCLPVDGRTWNLTETLDKETERGYWQSVAPYSVNDTDVERAARALVQHDRPCAAVELLAMRATLRKGLPVSLAVDALEKMLRMPLDDGPRIGSFSYYLSELLDSVAASGEINEERLAAIEWGFLPILEHHDRAPSVLHRRLAREPGFFAELVSLVFRAENEEPREVSPEDRTHGVVAYKLLYPGEGSREHRAKPQSTRAGSEIGCSKPVSSWRQAVGARWVTT